MSDLPRHPAIDRRAFRLPRLGLSLFASLAFFARPTDTIAATTDWFGDLRLRYEADWDSQNAAGVARADRQRGRVRLRGGFRHTTDSGWTWSARARTGSPRSQQSPHLTFAADNGGSDDFDVVADQYYLGYQQGAGSFWLGRNNLPFWKQNEFGWDDDVTPAGVAGTYEFAQSARRLTVAAGAFALPDGGNDFHGSMVAGQLKVSQPLESGALIFASSFKVINGTDGARHLLNRNGARDYLLGELNAQWQVSAGDHPLVLGADFFGNFADYDPADVAPFPAADGDETLGWVVSARWGRLRDPGDWRFDYYLAHIEAFAVNAAFAQDDWVRWGNGPQTEGTNARGHEFRVSYVPAPRMNIVARLYLVEAITSSQDGKRFRLDFNWSF